MRRVFFLASPCAFSEIFSGSYLMTTPTIKCQQLADCFKLLTVFFYEPEIDLWEQEDILNQFSWTLQQTSPGAFHFAKQMRDASEVDDEDLMKVDYAALFVGPFELPAAPYGSVYMDKNKRIMGDSTMAVLKLYQEAGLKVDVKDSPDHIAIELEFVHYLYSLEVEAIQDGDSEKATRIASLRAHFLTTCLAPWIRPFCQSIKNATKNLFYVNLADCLEVFITEISGLESISLQDHRLLPKENANQPAV